MKSPLVETLILRAFVLILAIYLIFTPVYLGSKSSSGIVDMSSTFNRIASNQSSPVSAADVNSALSKEEIGRRVESALRNAVYLEVTTTVTQEALDGNTDSLIAGVGPYIVKSIMAKDAFKTMVYDENGKPIMAFSVCDGRYQEYRPDMPMRPIFEFDSPYPHGTDNTVETTDRDCVAGGHIFSWVGVPVSDSFPKSTDMAWIMRSKIDTGVEISPGPDVCDQECWVFRRQVPVYDGMVEDTVFVDKQTYLVVRWDTLSPGAGSSSVAKRVRRNDIRVRTEIPHGTDWRITAGPEESGKVETEPGAVDAESNVGG